MKVDERWQHFDTASYPDNYIKEGSVSFIKEGLICVLISNCTFIRLPENHPWFKLSVTEVIDMYGYPTNTIGCAMNMRHFSPNSLVKESKKWLMERLSATDALEFFGNDLVANLGKDTPKRWLCITYNNLINPTWSISSTVKLSKEYRFRDARNAIEAALNASKSTGVPTVVPAAVPTKADDSEWQTVKSRRR